MDATTLPQAGRDLLATGLFTQEEAGALALYRLGHPLSLQGYWTPREAARLVRLWLAVHVQGTISENFGH